MNIATLKTPATPAPREKRLTLAGVRTGKRATPMRVVLYGVDGVGKSTFASAAPSPIFLGSEDGTAQLDVASFAEPKTWLDILDAADELATQQHSFQTLVIDSADWAEPLCWEHVCSAAKQPNIEAFGFGKGYVAALDEWRRLLARLDSLRTSRGMHIIVLAHAAIKSFRNPEGDDFDRYTLKLHQGAASLIKEWSDAVLFAQHETLTHGEKNARKKGISTGARIIYSQRRAAWDAKSRYAIPEELPLDWESFADAIRMAPTADELRAQLYAVLGAIGDEAVSDKATPLIVAAADDTSKLAVLLNKLNIKKEEMGK